MSRRGEPLTGTSMKTITLPAGLAGALLLSGCVGLGGGPLSSDADPNANARTGAVGGALAGALAGAAIDDENRGRGAAIGALAGAAIGGVSGANLDQQQAQLRAALSGQARIVNTGDRLVVTLPQDVLFATGSAQLTGSLQSDLAALARSMNQFPRTRIQVVGHADNTGTAAFNQDLSERRALAVAGQLAAGGVSGSRISAFGRGEDQPIASNLTPAGRAANRRVDIIIIPI